MWRTNVAIRTCTDGLVVFDPTSCQRCTWVAHSTWIDALCVLACSIIRAFSIPRATGLNCLRGWWESYEEKSKAVETCRILSQGRSPLQKYRTTLFENACKIKVFFNWRSKLSLMVAWKNIFPIWPNSRFLHSTLGFLPSYPGWHLQRATWLLATHSAFKPQAWNRHAF